jgi:hydroxyacylglutathione hydrolase
MTQDTRPAIHTFVLGDYQTNCFVVTPGPEHDVGGPCWIVDCGYSPGKMLDFVEDNALKPQAILLTHCHSDHIAGIDEAINRFGRPPGGMYVHEAEAEWCENALLNLSAMVGAPVTAMRPDHLLKGGETLELAGTHWRVLHTPGHSPGGVCYIHDDSKQAIVGDLIFAGSIGRIDFPTSDPDAMQRSLDLIMQLPDDVTIYPGHGPSTTIGRERRSNPFIVHGL